MLAGHRQYAAAVAAAKKTCFPHFIWAPPASAVDMLVGHAGLPRTHLIFIFYKL
jgi:hypothetical protein